MINLRLSSSHKNVKSTAFFARIHKYTYPHVIHEWCNGFINLSFEYVNHSADDVLSESDTRSTTKTGDDNMNSYMTQPLWHYLLSVISPRPALYLYDKCTPACEHVPLLSSFFTCKHNAKIESYDKRFMYMIRIVYAVNNTSFFVIRLPIYFFFFVAIYGTSQYTMKLDTKKNMPIIIYFFFA